MVGLRLKFPPFPSDHCPMDIKGNNSFTSEIMTFQKSVKGHRKVPINLHDTSPSGNVQLSVLPKTLSHHRTSPRPLYRFPDQSHGSILHTYETPMESSEYPVIQDFFRWSAKMQCRHSSICSFYSSFLWIFRKIARIFA